MTSNTKNIPTLRFKEFSGEWQEKTLDDLCEEFKSGKSITSKDIDENGEYPVYGGNGLRGYTNHYTHDDDIVLIGRQGALCGNLNLVKGKAFISEHAVVIKENNISNLSWLFYRLDYLNLNNYSESSAQPGLSVNKIKKIKVLSPTKQEQHKIADFLSTVDKKIQQLKQKQQLLQQYKKGMMQKLFSQQIRFKDENGQDYPEWNKKLIGAVAKIYDGTHQTPNYVEQGIPFYSVEHVTSNNFNDTKFIEESIYLKECKRVRIEKGDILMTRIGDIGTVKYIDWDAKASFYVSLALIKIQENKYSGQYLYFFIQSEFFQKELWARSLHVAFPKKINLGDISQCFVYFPCIKEQQKIADFLSSIDKKIDAVNKQISQMAQFKQGLLQQLFI